MQKLRKIIGPVLLIAYIFLGVIDNSIYPLFPAVLLTALGFIGLPLMLLSRKNVASSFWSWQQLLLVVFIVGSWLSLRFSLIPVVGPVTVLLDTGVLTIPLWLPYLFTDKLEKFLLGLLNSLAIVNVVVAIGQYLSRIEPRVAGLFADSQIVANYYPNAFALSCLLGLAAAGYGWPKFKEDKVRWLYLVGLLLQMVGLALSWSRAGWLASLLILTAIIFILGTRCWWQKILQFLGVGLVALVLVFALHANRVALDLPVNNLKAKTDFAGTEQLTSVNERQIFIKTAWEQSWQRPLIGYGPGSFPYVMPQHQEYWLTNAPHAHNWFLNLAWERGWLIAGALLFFALLFAVRYVYLSFQTGLSPEVHFLFWGLAAVIAHNLVDFNFNFPLTAIMFSLLLSLYVWRTEFDAQVKDQKVRNYSWLSLVAIVFSLAPLLWVGPGFVKAELWQRLDDQTKIEVFQESGLLEHGMFRSQSLLEMAYLYEQLGDVNALTDTLRNYLKLNLLDSNATNRLGILLKGTDLDAALIEFKRAKELDPKNRWDYYLNYLDSLILSGQSERISEITEDYIVELSQYTDFAEVNLHYTAQQQNIVNAQSVAQKLFPYVRGQQKDELQELAARLRNAEAAYRR